jgi:hypothetical protein
MIRTLAGLLLCLLATGCATMVNGRHQTIGVDSFPSGAQVEVDCGEGPKRAAPTPTKISVLRAAEFCRMTFTRPGYDPKTIELTHQPSRVIALNRAFALPGAVVFGVAGALVGAAVNGAETGAEIGVDAGWELGKAGATELDKKGGGWKWVPGKVFVVLTRPYEEDEDE